MYRTVFDVRGTGTFPLDMLRYDSCVPHTQDDVCQMSLTRARVLTLHSYHKYKKTSVPTSARWHSFGWEVVRVDAPDSVA